MIGCHFLWKISDALARAKGNILPFGGINVIMAGDFAQLPPVRETKLFANLDRYKAETVYAQQTVMGKALWMDVRDIVILDRVERQSGEDNAPFVDLLQRLRWIDLSCPEWNEVPIIFTNNDAKDAINVHAAVAFAQRTGQVLHWYYSTD
ncbi:hypothetical protein FPV67DRAFT_1401906, partial [Lyophyllum atratum]